MSPSMPKYPKRSAPRGLPTKVFCPQACYMSHATCPIQNIFIHVMAPRGPCIKI
jgi:hypothetical protein